MNFRNSLDIDWPYWPNSKCSRLVLLTIPFGIFINSQKVTRNCALKNFTIESQFFLLTLFYWKIRLEVADGKVATNDQTPHTILFHKIWKSNVSINRCMNFMFKEVLVNFSKTMVSSINFIHNDAKSTTTRCHHLCICLCVYCASV